MDGRTDRPSYRCKGASNKGIKCFETISERICIYCKNDHDLGIPVMVLWWHFLQDVIKNLQFYGRCCQWRVTREIQGMRLLLTWPLMRYKSQKASLCSIPGMPLAMAPFDASPDGHSRTIFIFAPDHSLDKCFSQTTGNFRSIFVV